jgi:hypothetical protein
MMTLTEYLALKSEIEQNYAFKRNRSARKALLALAVTALIVCIRVFKTQTLGNGIIEFFIFVGLGIAIIYALFAVIDSESSIDTPNPLKKRLAKLEECYKNGCGMEESRKAIQMATGLVLVIKNN